MAWNEERAEWAFLGAVIENDMEFYNKLSKEDKKKFKEMRAKIEESLKKNPKMEFYLPTSYED